MIQSQFINYLLDKKDASIITVNNLSDKFFSDYKDEFNYIKNHYETYGTICDKETFLNVFPTFEIINVGETPSYLVKALADDYNQRKLAEIFNQIRTLLLQNKTEEAMALYKSSQENLSDGLGMQCVDIIKDTSRFEEYVAKTKDFNHFYISTGFPELDKAIGGYDRQEELATIFARTGVGKSWTLLKSAVASARQGLNVGVYSGEMSESKVGYRVDTLLGHMNNGGITHGNSKYLEEYSNYIKELHNNVSGSIKVLTPKMINGSANVDALRAFIEKENLDILFIDQLSLLEDRRHGKTPVERMSNISKDLKNLQVLVRKPIISVCQANRTKSDDGTDSLNTTQIAQSDRIGQDSTLIISVEQRKDKIEPTNNQMIYTIVKSRDSVTGKRITYTVDLNVGMFEYIPDEDDAAGGYGDTQENNSGEHNHSIDMLSDDEECPF